MKNKDRIIEVINLYLEDSKKKIIEFEKKSINIVLYNELLTYLSGDLDIIEDNKLQISVLLDTIYNDDTYTKLFYSSLEKCNLQKNDLFIKKFHKLISREKDNLTSTIINHGKERENIRLLKSDCAAFLIAIKNKYTVSNKTCDSIIKIIEWAKNNYLIDDKEELILKNDINFYNELIKAEQSDDKRTQDFMEAQYEKIPDILNMGYQVYENIEINPNKKEMLNNIIHNMQNDIMEMKNSEIPEYINEFKNVVNDDLELDYLIINVMNNLADDLIANYSFLLDNSLYENKQNRKTIIHDYYVTFDKYLIVKKLLDQRIEEEEKIEEIDIEENVFETDRIVKKLVYSTSLVNPLKSKIVNDLKSIPEEYYGKIKELLTSYKDGSLPNKKIKKLVNNEKVKSLEIKDDQIRIIFDVIDENTSCIKGVFIKKVDNDTKKYRLMCVRNIPNNVNDEINNIIENELFNTLETEKREYSR